MRKYRVWLNRPFTHRGKEEVPEEPVTTGNKNAR
jgi:hypothetical protein